MDAAALASGIALVKRELDGLDQSIRALQVSTSQLQAAGQASGEAQAALVAEVEQLRGQLSERRAEARDAGALVRVRRDRLKELQRLAAGLQVGCEDGGWQARTCTPVTLHGGRMAAGQAGRPMQAQWHGRVAFHSQACGHKGA